MTAHVKVVDAPEFTKQAIGARALFQSRVVLRNAGLRARNATADARQFLLLTTRWRYARMSTARPADRKGRGRKRRQRAVLVAAIGTAHTRETRTRAHRLVCRSSHSPAAGGAEAPAHEAFVGPRGRQTEQRGRRCWRGGGLELRRLR